MEGFKKRIDKITAKYVTQVIAENRFEEKNNKNWEFFCVWTENVRCMTIYGVNGVNGVLIAIRGSNISTMPINFRQSSGIQTH